MKFTDLLASGELEGYKYGMPPSNPEFDDIDYQVCADTTCWNCKTNGLEYHPYINDRGSYRAFAVCSACNETQEF